MPAPTLIAVPNVSEGRDAVRIEALAAAFATGVELLDVHSDADHNRTVFTLAGEAEGLVDALAAGAAVAIEAIDMNHHDGVHPAIGALDVCPLVHPSPALRDAARGAAAEAAERIAALGVPVFLYGDLASSPDRAERAHFRDGGLEALALRMESGELLPDRGPRLPRPGTGAVLVTARPPLAAFNVELDSNDAHIARAVAARLRESGGGPAGVRAIGLPLSGGRAQVSTNIHDPVAVPLGRVVELVRELAAPLGASPVAAELVGLIPDAALAGYPEDVPIAGFDPGLHVIERRLAAAT